MVGFAIDSKRISPLRCLALVLLAGSVATCSGNTPAQPPVDQRAPAGEPATTGDPHCELDAPEQVHVPACPEIARPQTDDAPLYHEHQWLLRDGKPVMRHAEVVLYRTGAWRYENDGTVRTGSLSSEQMTALGKHIDDVAMTATTSSGRRCRALPIHRSQIVTSHGTVAWDSPCGASSPHPSVTTLQTSVHDAIGM
jgi:hypothetical protein